MLIVKEKKKFARYEAELAMPKWKFILVYGLSFGILGVIVSSIMDIVFDHISVSELFAGQFWTYLRIAPLGGLFFALLMRWFISIQYRKLKSKDTGSQK